MQACLNHFCYRVKWSILYRIRRSSIYHNLFYTLYKKKYPDAPVRLNLGCNCIYMDAWINLDNDKTVRADFYGDLRNIAAYFPTCSVDAVLLSHVISYLNLKDARSFFRSAFHILKDNAPLILEFPDIQKIAAKILTFDSCEDENTLYEYLECIRPIFALNFETEQLDKDYAKYIFAWSAMHICKELQKAGFRKISVLPTQYHPGYQNRDTRIEA